MLECLLSQKYREQHAFDSIVQPNMSSLNSIHWGFFEDVRALLGSINIEEHHRQVSWKEHILASD
jgi:hypothetical protein